MQFVGQAIKMKREVFIQHFEDELLEHLYQICCTDKENRDLEKIGQKIFPGRLGIETYRLILEIFDYIYHESFYQEYPSSFSKAKVLKKSVRHYPSEIFELNKYDDLVKGFQGVKKIDVNKLLKRIGEDEKLLKEMVQKNLEHNSSIEQVWQEIQKNFLELRINKNLLKSDQITQYKNYEKLVGYIKEYSKDYKKFRRIYLGTEKKQEKQSEVGEYVQEMCEMEQKFFEEMIRELEQKIKQEEKFQYDLKSQIDSKNREAQQTKIDIDRESRELKDKENEMKKIQREILRYYNSSIPYQYETTDTRDNDSMKQTFAYVPQRESYQSKNDFRSSRFMNLENPKSHLRQNTNLSFNDSLLQKDNSKSYQNIESLRQLSSNNKEFLGNLNKNIKSLLSREKQSVQNSLIENRVNLYSNEASSQKYSFGHHRISDSIYDLRSSKKNSIIGKKDMEMKFKKEDKGILKFRNNQIDKLILEFIHLYYLIKDCNDWQSKIVCF